MSAERITVILRAASTVTDLMGYRLYYGIVPAEAQYPAVQFRLAGGNPVTHLRGISGLENPEYQFDIYARTLDEAERLARAVREALANYHGWDLGAVPHGLPYETYDDGRRVYRLTFSMSIWCNAPAA